ncbi:MAG: 3-methylcrotonyl-CoA carboxylase alpha subunit [Granulosicoccus sp.]|jgi:3-methylcrotonyl-CoA carboxylase alpha subunit
MKSLLIANRGEIACRIMRTAKQRGLRTIAVYSSADEQAQHVQMADTAVCIGPALAADSYLCIDALIDAAKRTNADAIHPGYGFLSENPEFVDACNANGIKFVGPSAEAMRAMGRKDAAKRLMEAAGVPVVPGYHGEEQGAEFLKSQASEIGYPVLIKARSGGGGKGMRRVSVAENFDASLKAAQREAAASFGDSHVLIEKFVTEPRHIEVQVFGDTHGNVVHLFERDCSLQRRHQKVIEEAPAPGMTAAVRAAMTKAAVTAAKAINYVGAGTIEFIVDGSQGLNVDAFWFMEMNTRLQVEHPVTEAITGVDLVDWQLRIASGEVLPLAQDQLSINGHAVEARLYAEDPDAGFLPATGQLQRFQLSVVGRVDTGVVEGDEILPFYDPLLAKLITHASDRTSAFNQIALQLADSTVLGAQTNRQFLWRLVSHDQIRHGKFDTSFIDTHFESLVASEYKFKLLALACVELVSPIHSKGDEATRQSVAETLGGWQLWGNVERTVPIRVADELHTLKVVEERKALRSSQWRVTSETVAEFPTDGISLTKLSGSRYRVSELDEKATILINDGKVHVQLGAWNARFECVQIGANLAEATAEDSTLSPMPGRIVAVHCKIGDFVQAGQALISIEAMKMEQELCASRDGVVEMLAVAEGDQVSQGVELLRLSEI